MTSSATATQVTYQEFLGLSPQGTAFSENGKPVLLAAPVRQYWDANTDAFVAPQTIIREQQQQLDSLKQQNGNLQHQVSGFQEARAAADRSLGELRSTLRTTRQELEVTNERDALRGAQPQRPPQQPHPLQPPRPHPP